MSTNQETKAARQSLALTYKDGLFDLLLGSFFILLAIQEPLEQRGFAIWASYMPALLTMGLGLPVYYLIKRKVVTPRIGMASISFSKNKPRLSMFIFALALQLITVVIFILGANGWLGENMPSQAGWVIDAFFGVAIFSFFAFVGYIVDVPRFYIYGLLLGLSPLLGLFLPTDGIVSHIPVLLAGTAMVIGGIASLVSFLRNYPVVEMEEANE